MQKWDVMTSTVTFTVFYAVEVTERALHWRIRPGMFVNILLCNILLEQKR